MWSLVKSLAVAIAAYLGLRNKQAEAELDSREQETGAIKQREADLVEELRKREGQLDEATQRRKGDARRRLDSSDF